MNARLLKILEKIGATKVGIMEIPTSEVKFDQGLYPRTETGTDWNRVKMFQEMLEEGAEFPPILVSTNPDYILLDGNHRYEACKGIGREKIKAEIWEIPQQYRKLVAQACNVISSKPLTRGELKKAIIEDFENGIEDINLIAESLGCTVRYVRKVLQVLRKPELEKKKKEAEKRKEQIVKLREEGKSQKQIAKEVGVSKAYVQEILKKGAGKGTVPQPAPLESEPEQVVVEDVAEIEVPTSIPPSVLSSSAEGEVAQASPSVETLRDRMEKVGVVISVEKKQIPAYKGLLKLIDQIIRRFEQIPIKNVPKLVIKEMMWTCEKLWLYRALLQKRIEKEQTPDRELSDLIAFTYTLWGDQPLEPHSNMVIAWKRLRGFRSNEELKDLYKWFLNVDKGYIGFKWQWVIPDKKEERTVTYFAWKIREIETARQHQNVAEEYQRSPEELAELYKPDIIINLDEEEDGEEITEEGL